MQFFSDSQSILLARAVYTQGREEKSSVVYHSIDIGFFHALGDAWIASTRMMRSNVQKSLLGRSHPTVEASYFYPFHANNFKRDHFHSNE